MTVTTTYEPVTATGDGSTVAFSFPYLVYQSSHLSITIDGVSTSAWTAATYGDAAGVTVTFDTAPANLAAIIIRRIVPYTQDTDLENFDGNPADVTEKQFDLLAMADQQIAEANARAILSPLGVSLTSNEISGTIDTTTKLITITTAGPAVSTVGSISTTIDTVFTSLATSDLLQYDGTNWVNVTAASIAGTEFADNVFRIQDNTDATKEIAFESSGITTGTTRTITVPDKDITLAGLGDITFIDNYITGLTLSNDTDADHDILIATGQATDSTNADTMELGTAITKQIDAVWALGDDAGGLDTGTVAIDTWYHVFLIKRSDTGVVDALFSTSASSPTMPSSYDYKRRIGSILTDGSANIISFTQKDNEFLWDVPVNDLQTTNPSTSAVSLTLTVPTSIKVMASTAYTLYDTSPAAARYGLVTALDTTDTTPSVTLNNLIISSNSASLGQAVYSAPTRTNTSGQVRYRFSSADANLNFIVVTFGWFDSRGA